MNDIIKKELLSPRLFARLLRKAPEPLSNVFGVDHLLTPAANVLLGVDLSPIRRMGTWDAGGSLGERYDAHQPAEEAERRSITFLAPSYQVPAVGYPSAGVDASRAARSTQRPTSQETRRPSQGSHAERISRSAAHWPTSPSGTPPPSGCLDEDGAH